jgi:periplasmic protein TonB
MIRFAHLTTIRGALIVSLSALASAGAMAGDGKWVQDVKSCAAPEYPRESLSKGEQGTTALRILVGVDGKAIDSEIETSSHSHKLDSAAQRALMECSFKPQPADAKPAQQWVKTEFVWKLN